MLDILIINGIAVYQHPHSGQAAMGDQSTALTGHYYTTTTDKFSICDPWNTFKHGYSRGRVCKAGEERCNSECNNQHNLNNPSEVDDSDNNLYIV
jgi:hypothetical protein